MRVDTALLGLAGECRHAVPPLYGERALERLEDIFPDSWNFDSCEIQLLEIQLEFAQHMAVLEKLPRQTQQQIRAAIKAQAEFLRRSALVEYFDRAVQDSKRRVEEEEEKTTRHVVQQRWTARVKQQDSEIQESLLQNSEIRESLLQDISNERNELEDIETLCRDAEKKRNEARDKSILDEQRIFQGWDPAFRESYQKVKKLVDEREAWKIEFFLNNEPLFLSFAGVQNAFDAIIAAAARKPTCCDRIFSCFRPTG